MSLRNSAFFVLAVILFLSPVPSPAGGILHLFPPEVDGETFAIARPVLLLSRALITVSESKIEYRIDQTFYNNNEFPLKGLYLLPMGKDGPFHGLDVRVDGVTSPFKLFSGSEFFSTLRDLARTSKDPSLVGLAGREILLVRPVNIGARQQKTFRLKFEGPPPQGNDCLDMLVPLDGERYSLGPVGKLEVRVRFKLSRPIRNLFSPSHHFTIFRESPYRALVTVRREGQKVQRDFRLVTLVSGGELGMRLFTHRSPGRKGTFMAFVSPPSGPAGSREPDKDVVFLLDVSGSMGRTHLLTAKRAVSFCLERLRPGDRFNVITMGTRVAKMADRLMPATGKNLFGALSFVDSVKSGGGTDLYNGLMTALEQFPSRRRPCVVMLTGDGRTTVGITDPAVIVQDVRANNRTRARIFALALGDRADVAILDKVAMATRGGSVHFSGGEDFEPVMNHFLAGIAPPKASGLSIRFDNISPEDVMPDPIPDLFGQESVVIVGRYSDTHDVVSNVELRARLGGRVHREVRVSTFPEVDPNNSYLPSLWAMRRLAKLLEMEWLKGPGTGLRGKIDALAFTFGFRVPVSVYAKKSAPPSIASNGDLGGALWKLKTSLIAAEVQSDAFRHVKAKVFRRDGTRWVDTRYHASMPTVEIDFLGENYFSLLKQAPDIGPFLALGPEITLVRGEAAIEVTRNR